MNIHKQVRKMTNKELADVIAKPPSGELYEEYMRLVRHEVARREK